MKVPAYQLVARSQAALGIYSPVVPVGHVLDMGLAVEGLVVWGVIRAELAVGVGLGALGASSPGGGKNIRAIVSLSTSGHRATVCVIEPVGVFCKPRFFLLWACSCRLGAMTSGCIMHEVVGAP